MLKFCPYKGTEEFLLKYNWDYKLIQNTTELSKHLIITIIMIIREIFLF